MIAVRASTGKPSPRAQVLTASAVVHAIDQLSPKSVPVWRVKRREWSTLLRHAPGRDVIELGLALIHRGSWARLTAYELIAAHPAAMAALAPTDIDALAHNLADWGSVDTFACVVAGPAWREGRLPTRKVHAWLRSTNRWERRIGVVCTVALNVRARGGRGDTVRTLAVCRRVVADRDDMVVKALSWALRSLVKWDRAAVAAFLRTHEADLAARVKRQVGTKLRTGLKNA